MTLMFNCSSHSVLQLPVIDAVATKHMVKESLHRMCVDTIQYFNVCELAGLSLPSLK